ncbi:MAG: class II aldolase/adducin family protein [Motiliproteus sp.]|nr:class II aldolase/adducin family protein [Motiliproteus sp.]MCW9053734.1 class II aldolase/adducin family protein [Motiliproteus sp.]
MKSLWNDADANACQSLRALRVYSSRLLGSDPDLVLHGGGNTSVKETVTDLHGENHQILTVKGSGWDLGTIEEAGFAPVRMDALLKLAQLDELSDSDMVREQKAAMIDPSAPNPSIEAILHALIPYTFVDHSHADSIVTITNTPDGDALIREALGDKVLIVPYVMPGFILAKTIAEMTQDCDWDELEGIALMNHGLFTFDNDAKQSYEKHIELVTRAEQLLNRKGAVLNIPSIPAETDLLQLATIRKQVSEIKGGAVLARLNNSDLAITFANYPLDQIPRPGPLTPEHVIRTKSFGVVLDADNSADGYGQQLAQYQQGYQGYFQQHQQGQQCLNSSPNYALWKQQGAIAFGSSTKELSIIEDLNQHTFEAMLKAEALGGYQALESAHLFDIEYWELEQAKLAKAGNRPALTGKVVMIAETDSQLRAALSNSLKAKGAEVHIFDAEAPDTLVLETVRQCGGIDALMVNMSSEGASELLHSAASFLTLGIDPAIVYINAETAESHSGVRNNYLNLSSGTQTALAAEMAAILVADPGASGVSVNL